MWGEDRPRLRLCTVLMPGASRLRVLLLTAAKPPLFFVRGRRPPHSSTSMRGAGWLLHRERRAVASAPTLLTALVGPAICGAWRSAAKLLLAGSSFVSLLYPRSAAFVHFTKGHFTKGQTLETCWEAFELLARASVPMLAREA